MTLIIDLIKEIKIRNFYSRLESQTIRINLKTNNL